jgi:hypothetical protein
MRFSAPLFKIKFTCSASWPEVVVVDYLSVVGLFASSAFSSAVLCAFDHSQ